jgi:hypothetical protein
VTISIGFGTTPSRLRVFPESQQCERWQMAVDLNERVKTDMRLPRLLIKHVEEMAPLVGLPKNAFFTVAAATMAALLSRQYAPGKRRAKMLDALEKEVQTIFREARKAL